jgi:hypothetical protein
MIAKALTHEQLERALPRLQKLEQMLTDSGVPVERRAQLLQVGDRLVAMIARGALLEQSLARPEVKRLVEALGGLPPGSPLKESLERAMPMLGMLVGDLEPAEMEFMRREILQGLREMQAERSHGLGMDTLEGRAPWRTPSRPPRLDMTRMTGHADVPRPTTSTAPPATPPTE